MTFGKVKLMLCKKFDNVLVISGFDNYFIYVQDNIYDNTCKWKRKETVDLCDCELSYV